MCAVFIIVYKEVNLTFAVHRKILTKNYKTENKATTGFLLFRFNSVLNNSE